MLFKRYKANAMLFSGLEGIFGTIYLGIIVLILGFIPCKDEDDYVVKCTSGILVNSFESF